MSKIVWDQTGYREIEAGVSNVVLFVMENGVYGNGVAWNGVTAINENPSGAEITDLYADNIKYASLQAAEKYGLSIEAYTYPDEWNECDGSSEVTAGVYVGQQPRKAFGLCWRTEIGDDAHPGMNKGYKLHIAYNCVASPSGRGYTTINENPDALSFSWDANSNPVNVSGYKPTSTITIDSTKVDSTKLGTLKDLLYGTANAESTLPNPDTVISTIS